MKCHEFTSTPAKRKASASRPGLAPITCPSGQTVSCGSSASGEPSWAPWRRRSAERSTRARFHGGSETGGEPLGNGRSQVGRQITPDLFVSGGGPTAASCFILLHDHDLGRLSLQTLLFYHGTRTTRWLSFERLCLPGLLLPPFNTNVDRPCVTFFTYSSRRGGGGQRCVTVNVDCGRHRPRPWLSARRR